jgi:FxsC-like protein
MVSGRDDRPYFFLSYARTPKRDPADRDDPDRWVFKLYRDLCAEILQMTDARPEEAGFMDRENKIGAQWSPELAWALARCRVFVPLYSPRYFESDSCGREWFAFARREITKQARGGQVVDAIVPGLWTRLPRERLPDVAQSVQFDHKALGERYCAEGFYGIMKLQNYRADYQRAVHRLAERIIAIGEESVPLADEAVLNRIAAADFDSLPSAFGPESARRTADGQVHIAVLAHDVSTLPAGRTADYYGDTANAWTPYQPDSAQPVAEYAQELIRKCLDCKSVVGPVGRDMANWSATGAPMPPSLYLVDAWVSLSVKHQEQLRRLDSMTEPWVSVLVPWNAQDPGMREADEELRAKLEQQLGRKLRGVPRRCPMAAAGIPTLQDFGQILPEMTMVMLKRFRKEATAHPPAGPVIARPRLRRADRMEPEIPDE